MNRRIVIDTNVYVSRAFRTASVPGKAVDKVWLEDISLLSTPTWVELQVVLRRAKFVPYIQPGTLAPYLEKIRSIATFVHTTTTIRECRDPSDNKFLELAVDGRAGLILTGDQHLLELHPFRGVAILTPQSYLDLK